MRGLIASIVGVALTAFVVTAPRVIANESGEIHYWSSSYYPGQPVNVVGPSDRMVGFVAPVGAGTRVYFVNDDPAYDLSGAGDHWFLVGDGTAFHETSWKGTANAVFARTGTYPQEVIPITAEYRQDWLAVAAGDRPVRTFTSPRSVMDMQNMAVVPSEMAYTNQGPEYERYSYATTPVSNGTHYRAQKHRRTTYSLSRHRTYQPRQTYTTASTYSETEAVSSEPMAMTAVTVAADQPGPELFQIQNSWYMKSDGDWYRGESWRGPFVRVKKGTVPREVIASEKHESRFDRD